MRKLIFILIFLAVCLIPKNSCSQGDSTSVVNLSAIYLALEIGVGVGENPISLLCGIGGNFILSNNWGGSFSYHGYCDVPKELPTDYYPGFFEFFTGNQFDYLNSYSFRVLREFPTSTENIRFGIEWGVSVIGYKQAHYAHDPYGGWFTSNYIVTYSRKNSFGFSVRAKAEFPVTGVFGVELAAISNINDCQSYVGAEMSITLGIVRERITPWQPGIKYY